MPHSSKPIREYIALDKHLISRGVTFSIVPGLSVLPDDCTLNEMTLVIQKGAATLRRENPRLLYGLVQGPVILGLAAAASKIQNSYSLIAETLCQGYYLPAKDALQCIDRYQLWRESFYWMAWQTRLLELRDSQLIGANHYHQIRATILMMAGWEKAIRERIGVLNFIQQRTGISRSVIAEVLSALRKGGYIEMDKGKLVAVTRLPSDY